MASNRRIAKTATEGLKILWEEGFFKTLRKMSAVGGALAKRDNHFSDSELGMALKRAGYLTRRGKPRNYEYIQRYPYIPETKDDRPSPKAKKARRRRPSRASR
jgi:hypothetical protein